MDRWKKKQKKNAQDAEEIDPFFNDIIAGLSEDEATIEEEPRTKPAASNKQTPTKTVIR
jgi:hypothetical protein